MAQCACVGVVLGCEHTSPIHRLGIRGGSGLIASAASDIAAVGAGKLMRPASVR
jgi:hypothetical protein